ncbi:hypothetical protein B0J12DRAFT_674401 [Macrophomina phaseolina]|uniref:Uncharacterized protein n=1 Tax=Macrophomina phaseolina TaxID=35725 RepID=A0ABQ8G1W6_9PEZI|nr:hypothetical protein B0J12DRAFT_674401 [Macrophomina phaseolina]
MSVKHPSVRLSCRPVKFKSDTSQSLRYISSECIAMPCFQHITSSVSHVHPKLLSRVQVTDYHGPVVWRPRIQCGRIENGIRVVRSGFGSSTQNEIWCVKEIIKPYLTTLEIGENKSKVVSSLPLGLLLRLTGLSSYSASVSFHEEDRTGNVTS